MQFLITMGICYYVIVHRGEIVNLKKWGKNFWRIVDDQSLMEDWIRHLNVADKIYTTNQKKKKILIKIK